MIVNYDKISGFSTVFGKLWANSSLSSDFTKAWSEISKMTIKDQPTVWQQWGQTMGYTDKQLLTFLGDVDSGKRNINEMGTIINNTTKSTSTFSSFTSKAGSALKSFGSSMLSMGANMLAGFGIGLAIDGLIKGVSSIYNYATHQYTTALENAQAAAQEYESAQSELDSLNQKYDEQASKIAELNALKTAGTITMAQEVELANLQTQNNELQRQIDLQEQIVAIKQKASAQAAKEAATTEQSYTEAMQEEYGGFFGGLVGLFGSSSYIDPGTGEITSAYQQWKDQFSGTTNEMGLVKGYISNLEDLNTQLDEIQEKRLANPDDDSLKQQQEAIKNSITETQAQISESASTLQGWMDQITDSNGNITSGYEDFAESIRNTLNDINNIGKSTEEIDLNNLETFFSSHSGVEKYLKNIIEEGGSATDVLEGFKRLGLDLGSLDVSEEGFIRYFDDVKRSAEEAAEAINSIDGSFEGVQAAFESENQGAEWDAMASNLEQGLELLKQGRVGTDDFQTLAAWMSPDPINEDAFKYDADAYVEAWQKAYDKIKTWFNSEDPLGSMYSFAGALDNSNLADLTYDANGALVEVIPTFESTAEAADKLGVGVNAVEAAMRKLEEFGFEWDDITFSGEELDRYEAALDNVKQLYDSMESGAEKDRLKGMLEQWESNYDVYEQDLSKLTEDQVIHIEFEYDMASLEQEIDKLRTKAEASGGKNSSANADVIASNTSLINEYRSGLGLEKEENGEAVELPVQLKASDDSINQLLDQLQQTEFESDKYFEIQARIQNEQEIQSELYQNFSEMHPEINPDTSSIEEIENAWSDFFSKPQTIKADTQIDTETAQRTLDQLAEGSVIEFQANIDGAEETIKAVKQEDGTIKYSANIDGVDTVLTPVVNKDGTVTYIPDTTLIDQPLGNKEQTIDRIPNNTQVDQNPGNVQQEVDRWPDNSQVSSDLPAIFQSVIRTVKTTYESINDQNVSIWKRQTEGSGGLNGTAHIDGTVGGLYPIPKLSGRALAMGTLQDDSWLKSSWRTSQSNVALVGEEGPELIATRANRWYTVGDNGAEFTKIPLGSVVFNARQTRDLLSKGYINSRGTAMISGTAFATGGRLPVPGTSGYGYGTSSSASSSSSSYSSSSNNSNSNSSTSKATEEATKEFKEKIDEIEIQLDRMDRSLQKLTDSIETYSYDLSKQSSISDQAMNTIRSNLTTLQSAYNRYIKEANSVGLSDDWKRRVENGEIDITTVTDESLMDKINEYQDWWISRQCKIFLMLGTPKSLICHNVVMKYGQV